MRKAIVRAKAYSGLAALATLLAGCGGTGGSSPGGGGNTQPRDITLTLSAATALVLQDGTPTQVGATIGRSAGDTSSVTLSAPVLPSGIQAQFVQPGSGSAGTVTFVASAAAPAGEHSVTIQAAPGVSQTLALTVGIVATVGNTADSNLGVGGRLKQFLGIALAPDTWREWFLPTDWDAINTLAPVHISVHTTDYVPMKANSGRASDWDFSKINETILPALEAPGQGPLFTIAVAPPFLDTTGNNGPQFVFNDVNLDIFAQYCVNLVRYYNTGGFDWGGQHFQSPSSKHITWWQIFNEYNVNGLLPSQYIRLYNKVVPAMKAADPSIKVCALELAEGAILMLDPRNNLPWFVAPPASGGVNAPVDVATLHLYSSPHQSDSDAELFGTIDRFVDDVGYYYQQLRSRPDLSEVPVWVTESGVDSDYQVDGGESHSTGGPFVVDARGSSAFFAAWMPYLFSAIGKAGNQGLLHWSFSDDVQYGLISNQNNQKYLSYWVEYWLLRKFPYDGTAAAPEILTLHATETSTVETLATRNSDGSVVVMVANHAVRAPADNNGTGDPRTVILDISALGTFTSATQLTIGASTDTIAGPVETAITVTPRIPVTLGGYGVTFVTLHPAAASTAESYNGVRQRNTPQLPVIDAR